VALVFVHCVAAVAVAGFRCGHCRATSYDFMSHVCGCGGFGFRFVRCGRCCCRIGQALNSVPTARFTHFVHELASSTSSELVGGCAPKPPLLHLGYVSIGINTSNIVFYYTYISLFFFFLYYSISFNKYWNIQTHDLYQHYSTHTHIHTTTTKPQDTLYFYSLPP